MCEPCKTAEPIEMSFAVWTLVGPGNHVLGGGPDPLRGGGTFEESYLGMPRLSRGRHSQRYSLGVGSAAASGCCLSVAACFCSR